MTDRSSSFSRHPLTRLVALVGLLLGCGCAADSVELAVKAYSLPKDFKADITSPYPLAATAVASDSALWTYRVESLASLKGDWQLLLRGPEDNRIVDAKAIDLAVVLENVAIPLDRIARVQFNYGYSELESIDWPVGFAFYEIEITELNGTTTKTNCMQMPACWGW
jgi:hypothetical protein